MKFPDTWPADCPPADADDAHGQVYRLVKHDPPLAEDTASHQETGRLPHAPACLRCGLSVFREIRDAVHQRQLLPKLGGYVARATLLAEHGKTKLTKGVQPTHTTWWACDGVNRHGLFSVVREEG
jgi:hypothetical protein